LPLQPALRALQAHFTERTWSQTAQAVLLASISQTLVPAIAQNVLEAALLVFLAALHAITAQLESTESHLIQLNVLIAKAGSFRTRKQ
jgi:hypothetical protein